MTALLTENRRCLILASSMRKVRGNHHPGSFNNYRDERLRRLLDRAMPRWARGNRRLHRTGSCAEPLRRWNLTHVIRNALSSNSWRLGTWQRQMFTQASQMVTAIDHSTLPRAKEFLWLVTMGKLLTGRGHEIPSCILSKSHRSTK